MQVKTAYRIMMPPMPVNPIFSMWLRDAPCSWHSVAIFHHFFRHISKKPPSWSFRMLKKFMTNLMLVIHLSISQVVNYVNHMTQYILFFCCNTIMSKKCEFIHASYRLVFGCHTITAKDNYIQRYKLIFFCKHCTQKICYLHLQKICWHDVIPVN